MAEKLLTSTYYYGNFRPYASMEPFPSAKGRVFEGSIHKRLANSGWIEVCHSHGWVCLYLFGEHPQA